MRDINQQIMKFENEKNLSCENFYVSKSNEHIMKFLKDWPKWEKNFVNIIGENFSGKTHLINIFLKKFKGIRLESKLLNDSHLKDIKIHENIILENLTNNINEKLIYSLFNIIEQDNKYLIVTSTEPIVRMKFKLSDLRSRTKFFLLQNIEKPDDDLISALLIKNFSDRQITLEKKLINFIVKRIDRSYSKIFDFIYKIDELSLKKKRQIDLKIIKDVLGE